MIRLQNQIQSECFYEMNQISQFKDSEETDSTNNKAPPSKTIPSAKVKLIFPSPTFDFN